MSKLIGLVAAGAIFALGVGGASAGVLVDFTDADGGAGAAVAPFGPGNFSQSYGGVTVSISSTGGAINFNTGGPIGGACAAGPLACDRDGIGVGDTEIDKGIFRSESITVDFSMPVSVLRVFFLDLYPGFNPDIARVQFSLNNVNVSPNLSFGPTDDAFGYREGPLAPILADSIKFTTNTFDDYALAGVEFAAAEVPAPAALPLFGSLLAFFCIAARRNTGA